MSKTTDLFPPLNYGLLPSSDSKKIRCFSCGVTELVIPHFVTGKIIEKTVRILLSGDIAEDLAIKENRNLV